MVAFVAVRNSSFQSQEILILNWRVWTISVAGNPDFLAVNSMFQTNAYALYNMKVYFWNNEGIFLLKLHAVTWTKLLNAMLQMNP